VAHFAVLSVLLSFPFQVSVGHTFAKIWNQLKTIPRAFRTLAHFRKEAFRVLARTVHVFHIITTPLLLFLVFLGNYTPFVGRKSSTLGTSPLLASHEGGV
jgi:hypothetical protein